MKQVKAKFCVDDDYYHIKSINDILFNNHVTEHFSKDTLKKKNKNSTKLTNPYEISKLEQDQNHVGFATGKMLRSVFKDFLILDDVFEFLNAYAAIKTSRSGIVKYANDQRQIAVHKYGFRDANSSEKKIALNYI